MPCMATLPNTITLTHPVFVLQGDVCVVPTQCAAAADPEVTRSRRQTMDAPALIIASPGHPVTIVVDAVAKAGSKGASAVRVVVLPSNEIIATVCMGLVNAENSSKRPPSHVRATRIVHGHSTGAQNAILNHQRCVLKPHGAGSTTEPVNDYLWNQSVAAAMALSGRDMPEPML